MLHEAVAGAEQRLRRRRRARSRFRPTPRCRHRRCRSGAVRRAPPPASTKLTSAKRKPPGGGVMPSVDGRLPSAGRVRGASLPQRSWSTTPTRGGSPVTSASLTTTAVPSLPSPVTTRAPAPAWRASLGQLHQLDAGAVGIPATNTISPVSLTVRVDSTSVPPHSTSVARVSSTSSTYWPGHRSPDRRRRSATSGRDPPRTGLCGTRKQPWRPLSSRDRARRPQWGCGRPTT